MSLSQDNEGLPGHCCHQNTSMFSCTQCISTWCAKMKGLLWVNNELTYSSDAFDIKAAMLDEVLIANERTSFFKKSNPLVCNYKFIHHGGHGFVSQIPTRDDTVGKVYKHNINTYFITITPFLVAAVISILSTPVPARPTSLRRFPALRTSLVTFVAERTIKASKF